MEQYSSVRSWSTKDPESVPGSPYDSERADSAGRSFFLLGAIQFAASVSRRFRRELVVEAHADGVAIGSRGTARFVPWADVATIRTNLTYPRPTEAPAIALVLRTGEVLGLPDALYPDAATNFPSRRHIERARRIATDLTVLWNASSSGQTPSGR
jgi:hypothetical protein